MKTNFENFKWHEADALLKAEKHIWDRELCISLLGIIDSLIVDFFATHLSQCSLVNKTLGSPQYSVTLLKLQK